MRKNKTCKSIAIITALALIFTVFAAFADVLTVDTYAAAETKVNEKGTITNGPLNVRSGPGTGYKKIGTVAKGKTITVLTKQKNSKGETWYKYKYSSSKYGYVLSKYVKLKAASKPAETALNIKGTVNDGPLNVRSGPGTGYKKIGTVSKGKIITVLTKQKNSKGETWYKYKYSSSKYGYVSSKYVDLSEIKSESAFKRVAVVKVSTLKFRSGPGSSYKELGKLKKKESVKLEKKIVLTSGAVWYQFKYDGKTAYASGKSQYWTITNIVSETDVNKKATTTDVLNVRTAPDSKSDKLGQLESGKVITVLTKVVNTAGETWYKYKFSSDKYGYVLAEYVELGVGVSVKIGTVTTDSGINLNVRSNAGSSYSKIGSLPSGAVVTITGSKKDSGGKVWYSYQFSENTLGWICSDYVNVKTVTSTAAFEQYMDEQGFPESYKPALRALKAAHPEWVFKAYDVGCSWDTAVKKENAKPGINVVSSSSPKSYRSKDKDCYNSKTGVWSRYDGGWYSAHTDVIRYYMDPRNFLNEKGIYQFLTHKYDSATQSTSTVAAVTKGTFMETRSAGEDWKSFAHLINSAGKKSGVSPNVLAAMIIQEQGVKGTSGSISGKVKGYEGYYNFLNIGAWTTSTMTAVERGLWYATEQGWDTQYKSILGGAKTYYNNYIQRNQYTFYTKKFNVMNGESQIGVHQYMTNVQGAYGEGVQLKKAFPDGYDKALTFIIPVYEAMPAEPCDLP